MADWVFRSQIGSGGRGHFQVWIIQSLEVIQRKSLIERRMLPWYLFAWRMMQNLRHGSCWVLEQLILFLRGLLINLIIIYIAWPIFLILLDGIMIILSNLLKHYYLLLLLSRNLVSRHLKRFIAKVLIRNSLRWILYWMLKECVAIRGIIAPAWGHHDVIKFFLIKEVRLLVWISLSHWGFYYHFIVIMLRKRKKVHYFMLFLRKLELCWLHARNFLLMISNWKVYHFKIWGNHTLSTATTTHAFIGFMLDRTSHFTRALSIWSLGHMQCRWRRQYFIKLLLFWLIMTEHSFLLSNWRHLKYCAAVPLLP